MNCQNKIAGAHRMKDRIHAAAIISPAILVVLLVGYVKGFVTQKYRSKLMINRFITEALDTT